MLLHKCNMDHIIHPSLYLFLEAPYHSHLDKIRVVGIFLDIKICNRSKLYCHYHQRYLIVLEKNVALPITSS